jgi:peroxiredoxin
MSQLLIGVHAPNFELKDLNGQLHGLSSTLGRGPLVLAFFKADCPTCQFTFPHLQKIFSDARRRPATPIWGISQDDVAVTRGFAEEFGITFDLLIDEYPYPVSSAYGLKSVPAIFMVETDGIISLSDFGFTKSTLNQIAGFEFLAGNDGLPASRPG